MPRIDSTQPPTEPRISASAGRIWCLQHVERRTSNDQFGMMPIE